MQSAFGIDHGDEITKIRLPRRPVKTPPPRAPSRASQIGGKLNRLGEKDISIKELGGSAGRGVGNVGSFMQRHPGLTGTALVGGGGAGGYKVITDRQRKKAR
jgi:hypothetical protein